MIRDGLEKDIPDIVRMAEEFWRHTQFDDAYDPIMVECMAQECMRQSLMKVLVTDKGVQGFICGIKGPLMASGDIYSGTEIAWWVDPDARKGNGGIELLNAIEGAAKAAGCKYWTMVFMASSMPDEIEKIYQNRGYTLAETSYTKRLL